MLGASKPFENVARAPVAQLVRQPNAAQPRLVGIERDLAADNPLPGDVANEAVEHTAVAAAHGQRADRHLTSALEGREKRPLGLDVDHRLLIADAGKNPAR